MYHLNTFPLPRNEGVNWWEGGSACKKLKKSCHKNNKISTLTWLNNSLENAMKVGIFLMKLFIIIIIISLFNVDKKKKN